MDKYKQNFNLDFWIMLNIKCVVTLYLLMLICLTIRFVKLTFYGCCDSYFFYKLNVLLSDTQFIYIYLILSILLKGIVLHIIIYFFFYLTLNIFLIKKHFKPYVRTKQLEIIRFDLGYFTKYHWLKKCFSNHQKAQLYQKKRSIVSDCHTLIIEKLSF